MESPPLARSSRYGVISAPARFALELALLCTVLLLAWQFAQMHVLGNMIHQPSAIHSIASLTAETPFQYRLLVPMFVDWLHGFTTLHRWLGTRLDSARLIEVLSLVGSYYALRSLLGEIAGRGCAALCALGLFYCLPFQYVFPQRWPYWYASDIPGVLFFALGILLLRRRAWALYYSVFALATLNRETICFLTLIQLLVHFGEIPHRQLVLHLAAQAVIFVSIKLALFVAFRQNPGPGLYYERVWAMNLDALAKPGTALLMASNFGFLWLPVAAGWKLIRDRFTRRALLVVPVYFGAAFYGAQFDEIRLYGELAPLVLIGAVALGAAFAKDQGASAGLADGVGHGAG